MTVPENHKPLWDESLVETLLEDYFRREMPEALRSPDEPGSRVRHAAVSSATASGHAGRTRANSKTGGLMVAFTMLLLLMVVLVDWDPIPEGPSSKPSADLAPNEVHEEDPTNALRRTGDGPVELRPGVHSVGRGDPRESHTQKSPFPELDVEVYPLDGETPMGRNKAEKPDSSRTPMPEEHRELPEGQLPGTDPDEAQLEPMLPELQAIFPDPGAF